MTPYKSPPFLDVATLPQTNIAPENGWLEDELLSFWGVSAYFQVPCWLKPRWGDIDPFTITCKPTTFFRNTQKGCLNLRDSGAQIM